MKIEIQRLLEKAERGIHVVKEKINEHECQVNEYEESLAKLRKGLCQNLYMRTKLKHGIIITHTHVMSLWLMTEI